MNRVGHGVTGLTTAKVSSQHGLIYDRLRSSVGEDHARVYGEANEEALRWIVDTVERERIECDLRRRPAFAYAAAADERDDVEMEAEAAATLGLPATFTDDVPLPYPTHGAVRFADQAEFDSYRYTEALAQAAEAAGARIVEGTRATGLNDGSPCRVEAGDATVVADQAVLATHFPFADRSLAFARAFPMRSYCVATRAPSEPIDGMFISAGSSAPTRSVRFAPHDGGELLIVGGEGHKAGTDPHTEQRYERLAEFAREHFHAGEISHRWSSQDPLTADHIPFVGPTDPRTKRLFMATGYGKWGMTNGTVAALILADRLAGRDNDWASTFESNRVRLRASLPELIKENSQVGFHFFADRVRHRPARELGDLANGEGGVVRHDGQTVGGFRDDHGELHAVSLTCTHLGCRVLWNEAERSWDCPCHGSRFAYDGTLLEGPAVRDLDRKNAGP
jgi:glycine/D-amino acid oxidase-like deaminating enzyme/nitrite reductase/ring-hydroxylating ferredoxin subunit